MQSLSHVSSQTPLHYAAVSGQGDVCLELLLNDGASPNSQVRMFKPLDKIKSILLYGICTLSL